MIGHTFAFPEQWGDPMLTFVQAGGKLELLLSLEGGPCPPSVRLDPAHALAIATLLIDYVDSPDAEAVR